MTKLSINLLIVICFCFCSQLKADCQYNPKCFFKCKASICQYDQFTNSFYNSSISNTFDGYQGQGCCNGCQTPFNYDHYFDSENKNCIQRLCDKDQNGSQLYWIHLNNSCVSECASFNLFKNNLTGRCEYNCSEGTFGDNQKMKCVQNCPTGFSKIIKGYQRLCLKSCYPLFMTQEGYCVNICPQSTYKLYGQNSTNKCVFYWECRNANRYVDKETKQCVSTCRAQRYANGYCINDNSSGNLRSVSIFPSSKCQGFKNQFQDPNTGQCISKCPAGLFADQSLGKCVLSTGNLGKGPCSGYQVLLESLGMCVSNCNASARTSPTPFKIYIDNYLGKCVGDNQCSYDYYEKIQTYASYGGGTMCLYKCSANQFAHPGTKRCQDSCFGDYPHRNFYLRICTAFADQSILNYVRNQQNISDKVYVLSQTTVILIMVGVAVGILLIIGGVIFYKCYAKKRIFRKYMDNIQTQQNIQYTA